MPGFQVLDTLPPPPTKINPHVTSRPVSSIKCLEEEPSRVSTTIFEIIHPVRMEGEAEEQEEQEEQEEEEEEEGEEGGVGSPTLAHMAFYKVSTEA